MWAKNKNGFTIVELLVVVVVIAILASITTVAYGGLQQQARDVKRKDDVHKIVQAMQLWSIQNNTLASMNAGASGQNYGFFDGEYAPYPTMKDVLLDEGLVGENTVDPINRKSGDIYAYIVAMCDGGDSEFRVVLARLEVPPDQTVEEQLGNPTCSSSQISTFTSPTGTYKMNYAKIVTSY